MKLSDQECCLFLSQKSDECVTDRHHGDTESEREPQNTNAIFARARLPFSIRVLLGGENVTEPLFCTWVAAVVVALCFRLILFVDDESCAANVSSTPHP
jgi:hypothetical protein